MSVADTLAALEVVGEIRELITDGRPRDWRRTPQNACEDASNNKNRAWNEAHEAERRFAELARLYAQRCHERATIERKLNGSQALEEPEVVGANIIALTACDRVISDLVEAVEAQRKIATEVAARSARWQSVNTLCRAIARNETPPADLCVIFGVSDPLELLPVSTRCKIERLRAESEEAEARAKAEAERRLEEARIQAKEREAQFQAERARIDGMPLEEVAAMFFKDVALESVINAIHNGPDALRGLAMLDSYASGKNSIDGRPPMLDPIREYALDRLLTATGRATVKEYRRRYEEATRRPEPAALTAEAIALSDDWRSLIPLVSSDTHQLNHYFLNGCTDGRGAYLLQQAIEAIKSRSEIGKAAILRLNELAQSIRQKPARASV
jgi:hypothetical protein